MKPFRKFMLTTLVYSLTGLLVSVPIGLLIGIVFFKAVVLCIATVLSMIAVNILGIWLNKGHYERTL